MKKYIFEATKRQWEKTTEPKQILVAPARVVVIAKEADEALEIAKEKFREKYLGTGTILGEIRMVDELFLPADWSYGYSKERTFGSCEDKCALKNECTK
jgi:hypothetical protein